ncbi:hydrolase [Mesorhizobium sp.]|uniref:hydrolase n=1 Tax=Mesorhizobium sp. TaxID=1871066 RepID=UPI00344D5312
MGRVFARVHKHIGDASTSDADQFLVLRQNISSWSCERRFSVLKPVPGEEMTRLSIS